MFLDAINLERSWKTRLEGEFTKNYMLSLEAFLQEQSSLGKIIYPKKEHIFSALNAVPFEKVKVVVLGQDPYHGMGQAHGFCFSIPEGVPLPPSLKNIIKELENDLGTQKRLSGNLKDWAEQGVLLLNSVLTVEASLAASHQKKGWEQFTDKIISLLNNERDDIVFLLWGAYAQKKGAIINAKNHCVLKSVHPSPLSAHRGFFGCGHFSKTNAYLKEKKLAPIIW